MCIMFLSACIKQSTITLDTFSFGLCPLLHPDQYYCDSLNEWKPGNRFQSTHRAQGPFHSVERQSMLIISSAAVEKKKGRRHFHALFFSLSISVSLARLNLCERTLIKRIYREEQPCEIEPFLLNLDEKLWQLFIFVSGLPSHPSSFPLHLFSFLLRVCDRAIFASLFYFIFYILLCR